MKSKRSFGVRIGAVLSALWLAHCGSAKPAATSADAGAAGAKAAEVSDGGASDAGNADAAADLPAASTLWAAALTKTDAVDKQFSQGLAKIDGGWLFSAAGGLWRTDEKFVQQAEQIDNLIPPELDQMKFHHLGDIDVANGLMYGGLEQPDYGKNQQAIGWWDPKTLQFLGYQFVQQAEFAWVAVEPTPTVAYTMAHFSDDTVIRYDAAKPGQWKLLAPLKLSRKVDKVQGGDVAQGALWLSTDDDHHGLYRADLQTGDVQDVGTLGHNNGFGLGKPEGEGIDASDLPSGQLHTLTGEFIKLTSWVDHFQIVAPKK